MAFGTTATTCSKCRPGYNLTTDNTLCLPSIPYCVTYASSSSQSTKLTCSVCNTTLSTILPDSSACLLNIPNC